MDRPNNYTNALMSMDVVMELVSMVVRRFFSKSSIPHREREDVEMAILEKFLKQQEKINAAFENKSNIKTYYLAVINRMCCEVIRSECKHWQSVSSLEIDRSEFKNTACEMEPDTSMIIKNEIKRFSNLLLFFNEERDKILLFLKFLFDIPIRKEETREYLKDKQEELYPLLLRDQNLSLAEQYNILAQITNSVEDKNIKGDAIRMWMNKQIEIMLRRLNENDESNHTKESLKILMEMSER